jgi:ribonuclease HII
MIDIDFLKNKPYSIFGSDEVGRGCLAGPVVVCTVEFIHPKESSLIKLKELGINDSKSVSEKKRVEIINKLGLVFDYSKSNQTLLIKNDNYEIKVSISQLDNNIIDSINILNATLKGMEDSFKILYEKNINPNSVWLIDGNKAPDYSSFGLSKECIIKGDSKSVIIGLASIIAKQFRDYLMKEIFHKEFPQYDFNKNVGYGSKSHINAIKTHGRCQIHRQSFKLAQLNEK